MGRLSVAIITKDEEENIRDCLESVRWADEIVIVDSFSQDATVQIAKEYTSLVFQEEWQGYARQKQSAINKTTGDRVLSIDADERVTPELRDEIHQVSQDSNPCQGYFIPRKNYFCGRWIRHCGWYPDHTLRLFQKGTETIKDRHVHEAIEVSRETGYLKHPLEHYTYKNIEDYVRRMDRYSTLGAKDLYASNKRAGWSDITLRPLYTFFYMYFIRRGFLEGSYGLVLSGLYAAYTFSKYLKLKELHGGLNSGRR